MTIGRHLAEKTGSIFIHDHLVINAVTAIYPFGAGRFENLRSLLFGDVLSEAIRTHLSIVVTHADDIFWSPDFNTLLKSVTENDYDLVDILLKCDEEEHARRICDPMRLKYQKISDMEWFRRSVSQGEFRPVPSDEVNLCIDTTHVSADEVATIIANEFFDQPS
jgi:hypothetical protein